MPNKRTFKIGEQVFDVEEKDVPAFLKEAPTAEEYKSFKYGNDTFDVKVNDVDAFLKEAPDATPIFGDEPVKKKAVATPTVKTFSESYQDLNIPSSSRKTITPSPLKPGVSTSKSESGKPNLFEGVGGSMPSEKESYSTKLKEKVEIEDKLLNDPTYTLLSGNELNPEKRARVYEQKNEAIAKERGYKKVDDLYADMDETLAASFLDERGLSEYQGLRNLGGLAKSIAKAQAAGQPTQELEKAYQEGVTQYSQAKAQLLATANQEIKDLRMALDDATPDQKAEILDKIKLFEASKENFFKDKKVEAAQIVKQEGLQGNISDQEKVRRYAHSLMRERSDLRQQLGLQGSVGNEVTLDKLKELGYNTVIDNPYYDRLVEVEAKLKSVAPIALLNESPITDTEGAATVFGKTFMKNLVPKAGVDQTQLEKGNTVLEGLRIAGVDTENVVQNSLETLSKIAEPYEDWSAKDWAAMTGATAAFIPKFVIASALTEGMGGMSMISPYWRSVKILSQRGSLGTVARESTLLRTLQSNSYGRGLLKTTFKGAEFGTQSQVESMLFQADRGEVNALTGFVGGAIGKQAEIGLGLFGKAVSSFFGSKAPEATNKMIQFAKVAGGKIKNANSTAIGETGEELGEELGGLWLESENGKDFINKVTEQFGDPSKATKFFLASYMMGLAFGAGSELGKYSFNKSEKLYSELSPADKAIADQIISDIKQEQNQAETQAGVTEIEESDLPDNEKKAAIKEVIEQGNSIDDVISGNKTVEELQAEDPFILELEKLKEDETKKTEETKAVVLDSETTQTTDIDGGTPAKTEATTVQVEGDVERTDKVEPIRQLGTGANVYFETDGYRVNDGKDGKTYLIIADENDKSGFPLTNINFDNTDEAVFVAKKISEIRPNGLTKEYDIDKIIDRFKEEYKQSLSPNEQTPQNKERVKTPEITKESVEKQPDNVQEGTPDKDLATQEKGEKTDERKEERQNQGQVLNAPPTKGKVGGEGDVTTPKGTPPAKPNQKEIEEAQAEIADLDKKLKKGEITKTLHKQLVKVQKEVIRKAKGKPPVKYNVANLTPRGRALNKVAVLERNIDSEAVDKEDGMMLSLIGFLDEESFDIQNNITPAQIAYLKKQGVFAEKGKGQSLEQIAENYLGATDERISDMAAYALAELNSFDLNNFIFSMESKYDLNEQQRRYDEEAAEAEQQAKELEEAQRAAFYEEADVAFEQIEEMIDGLTEEQLAELESLKTDTNELNQKINEYGKQESTKPDTTTEKGQDEITSKKDEGERDSGQNEKGTYIDPKDGLLKDEDGNIIFEPKIEYENETTTKEGQKIPFTSQASTGVITSEPNISEQGSEAYNPSPDIKSITWVERTIERTKRFDFTGPNKIKSAADVAFLFRHLESAVSENAFAVLIDKNGKYKVVYISTGATTAAIVDMKPIIAAATEFKADSVVLVHNHPSGRLEASQADKVLHSKLNTAMAGIGIRLHDSVIINLDTGKFAEFTNTETGVSERKTEADYKEKLTKPRVYEFSKQVLYDYSWTKSRITSSRDAAEFVSRQKRGAVPKMGVIVLDRANNINRYILIDPNLTANQLTKIVLQEVAKHGESVILSTNNPVEKNVIDTLKMGLNSADMALLDIVVTQQDPSITSAYESYADEGKLNEQQDVYGTQPQLKRAVTEAKATLTKAENDYQKARNSYEKALAESQIDLMGNAKQDVLLFKSNLPALNKKVKEFENKRDEAKALLEKAQTALDNFVPGNQVQMDLPSKIRGLKIDGKGKVYDATIGIPVALYNTGVEMVAKAVEGGIALRKAIESAVKYIDEQMKGKQWDRGMFYKDMNIRYSVTLPNGKKVEVEKDSTRETAEVINGWYSPIEQKILDTKVEKTTGKEWIKKLGGGEEMQWTGLEAFLNENANNSLTKKEVQQYLKDNRVSVVEVVKGDKITKEQYNADAIKKGNAVGLEIDFGSENEIEIKLPSEGYISQDEVSTQSDREFTAKNYGVDISVLEVANDLFNENESKRYRSSNEDQVFNTKFSQYQLEGDKSNYKEVLVTLPTKIEKATSVQLENGNWKIKYPDGTFSPFEYKSKSFADKDIQEGIKAKGEIKKVDEFRSTHFDEPNILVHLRMNTRTDADGNKVLFLEELQSDWGQKGKKEGFVKEVEKTKWKEPRNVNGNKVYDSEKGDYFIIDRGEGRVSLTNKDAEEIYDGSYKTVEEAKKAVEREASSFGSKGTPNAPFVTDTNAWTKLGLKVALKEAVKQGADKIAWTTGEQQNDRYDLSKQVDELNYFKNEDGTYTIKAYKNSSKVVDKKNVNEKELEGMVGKDVAEKIINDKGEPYYDSIGEVPDDIEKVEGEGTLSGEGLKVGGKGMKGFYGSPTEGSLGIVGNVAKSLFKQELGTVEIETEKPIKNTEYENNLAIATKGNNTYRLFYDSPHNEYVAELYDKETGEAIDIVDIGEHNTESLAIAAFKKKFPNAETLGSYAQKQFSTQYSIDITPELKASVSAGLPLFSTDSILKAIDSLKVDTKGKLNAFGLIPAAWNATLDVVKAAWNASKNIAEAIEKGMAYARKWAKENNANFDEAGAKKALEKAYGMQTKQPSGGLASATSKTPADLKRQAQAIADAKLEYFKEIKDALKRIGVNIAEGYLSKRNYGIYKYNPKKIRVQSLWKIGTVTHEVAHWVSDNFDIGKTLRSKNAVDSSNPNASTNKKLRKELTRIYVEFYPDARPEHSLRLRVEEGIAVLLQQYFYNPTDIGSRYPELVKEFITPGGLYYNDKFTQTLGEMNGLMDKYSGLLPQEQLGARIARGKELLKNDKLKFTWGQKLDYELFKSDEILKIIDDIAGSSMTNASAEIAHRRWQTRGHIASNWVRGQQAAMTIDKNGDWKPLKYSMKDMAKEIQGKEKEFDEYLVARRALGDINRLTELENELATELQNFDPTTATKEEIEAIEQLQKNIESQRNIIANDDFDVQNATDVVNMFEKQFEKATEIFDYMNNATAEFAYHTGLISGEQLSNYQANPTYAAFRRLVHDDMGTGDPSLGGSSQKSKITATKSRTGSTKQIISPVYSQMFHITETINKGMQNQIWKKLAQIAQSDSFVADNYFEQVETQVAVDEKTGKISYPQITDKNLVPVWTNGKPKFYIASKELLAMAEIMKPQELHMALFFARRAAGTFARLTTSANVLFPLVNMPVDTMSAWMNTKTGFKPIVSQIKTIPGMLEYMMDYIGMAEKFADFWNKIRNKPINTLPAADIKMFEKYLALGGSTQTLAGYLQMTPDEVMKAIRNENNVVKATKWIEDHTLGLLELPSNISEYMTRFAEFKRAKEQGKSDDVAMWMASEVSVPFIQQGNIGGRFGREFVRTIPYFNASLQVLGKLLREAKDNPARVALVSGAILSIQIGLAIATVMDSDDEDLQMLSDLTPEQLSKFIYIPKAMYGKKGYLTMRVPEQIGWMGATALMAMLELKKVKDYSFKDYVSAATSGIPQQFKVWEPDKALMAYTPQIVKPSMEVITNTKTFPNIVPIVPYGLSTKLPEYQYTQYTSEVAKMLGKQLNASPMLVDHFMKAQFGKVPAMVIDVTESYVFDKKMKYAKLPINLQAEEFVLRGTEMNKFYENLQYWNKVNRSLKDKQESGDYSDEDLMNLKTSYNIYEGVNTIVGNFRDILNNDIEIPFEYRDKLHRTMQLLNDDLEPYKHSKEVMDLFNDVTPWINEQRPKMKKR